MRKLVFCFCVAFLGATSAAQAVLVCTTKTCFGKPMKPYTFKQQEKCETVYKRLNFGTKAQLERINFDISGFKFKCTNTPLAGQLICYPQAEGVGNKC